MLWKRKTYPEFWTTYLEHFRSKQEQNINSVRFVVFDTETTGLNIKTDRILSIGCIAVKEFKIQVSDQLEIYLQQDVFKTQSVKIHGLLKDGATKKINEQDAVNAFLAYLQNAVIVAHHAAFDVAMINKALQRLGCPKLKNTVLDTGHLFNKTKLNPQVTHHSLDDLAKRFNIPLHDRHTASGDAYITALVFLKLLAVLAKTQNQIQLKHLTSPTERIGLL